jgi:hypothetical protein
LLGSKVRKRLRLVGQEDVKKMKIAQNPKIFNPTLLIYNIIFSYDS